jgi:hypothetical protein
VTPSSTISGAAPHGVPMIGVPHASASIITMPKGSGQAIGFNRHAALPSSSRFAGPHTSPM